ncbi:MAG: VanZ family protein [Pseudobutyrivibrio sp.]|nr:VanZ family protein [Pseudobutyrivibrio sp.]
MIEISFLQMFIFLTVVWILVRYLVNRSLNKVDLKRELQLILVYICIVVISRMVYFPLHLKEGHIAPLLFDASRIVPFRTNFQPFVFTWERYDGWKINIIGNITMFIPVGIVWPVCFKQLNNVWKVTLAGFVYTLLIEISQLPFYDRCTDVDDLILNTTGVFIGAVIYFVIASISKLFKKKVN